MPRWGRSAYAKQAKNRAGYEAPILKRDTIDELVQKVDQEGTDKYRAQIAHLRSDVMSDATGEEVMSVGRSDVMSVSTTGSQSDYQPRRGRLDIEDSRSHSLLEDQMIWAEDDYYPVKQSFGYLSIGMSAFQLLVLMMQLALCGVAPLDVNPLVGPYPDTFSEWGGKNAYLLKEEMQLWRVVSPVLLHVGVVHLLLNAYVQLETCAFFEREWGSCTWLCLYVVSEIGCILTSCVTNPDTIGVGSSGALMGLFGAKLAHVTSHVFFEVSSSAGEAIQLEQLSGLLCSLALMLSLSFFTYIDWSGHMGGLGIGFLAGMLAFAKAIRNPFSRFVWRLWSLAGLASALGFLGYTLWYETQPDEDLKDACSYFRNLFSEGYDCQCLI